MGRRGWMAFGLVALTGCGSGSSVNPLLPTDAGPDAVEVQLDGGGAPATPPDGAAACPTGVCNYQTGTGCPSATPACLPSFGTTKPVPACFAAGSAQGGAACAQANDCVAGHICVAGVCRKLCCGGDWTGCDSPGEHCIERLDYSTDAGVALTGAMLCYPIDTCDALTPSSCAQPGTSCLIADATGATACLPAGSGAASDPCPCMGGFTCVQASNQSPTCVRLCKAVLGGGEPYCQPDEGICTHYNRDPPGVGECAAP